jgi:hypothetical protein
MFEACGQHIAWPLSRFAAAVLLRDIYTLDSWRMLEGSPLPLEGSAITEVGTQNSEWTLWLSTCIRGLWVFKTVGSWTAHLRTLDDICAQLGRATCWSTGPGRSKKQAGQRLRILQSTSSGFEMDRTGQKNHQFQNINLHFIEDWKTSQQLSYFVRMATSCGPVIRCTLAWRQRHILHERI